MHPTFALTPAMITAAVLTLAIGRTTRWFTGPVPSGGNSMALLNPALAWAGSWFLVASAVVACAARGRLAWVWEGEVGAGAIGGMVVVGLAAIAFQCFAMWVKESPAVSPRVATLGAVVMPLTVQAFLVMLAWNTTESLGTATWPRIMGGTLAAVAALGLWMVGAMLVRIGVQRAAAAGSRDTVAPRRTEVTMKGTMLFSILITMPLIVAAILTLAVAASTGFFTARVPTGPDVMGLATPILAAGASWLLTLLAAWACIGRGGLDWISGRPLVPTVVCTLGVAGLCVIAIGAFALWGERSTMVPKALLPVGGTVVPLALQGLLIACAWASPGSLGSAAWTRAIGIPLGVIAVLGLVAGGKLLVTEQRNASERAAKVAAEARTQDGERRRRNSLSRKDRVIEDLAATSPDEPFWKFAAMMAEETDEEARRLIVARGSQVKDLDADLAGCLVADYPILRGGAAEFIRASEPPRALWAAGLADGMKRLALAIKTEGMAPQERYSVQFEAELRSELAAAALFKDAEFGEAKAALREAVEASPACEERTRALEALR